jgi:hypothetical protein
MHYYEVGRNDIEGGKDLTYYQTFIQRALPICGRADASELSSKSFYESQMHTAAVGQMEAPIARWLSQSMLGPLFPACAKTFRMK